MIYEIRVTDSSERRLSDSVLLTTGWMFTGRWKALGASTISHTGGGHDGALWHYNPILERITLKEDGREILYLDQVRQQGARVRIEVDEEGTGWLLQPGVALRDYHVEWKCLNALPS